MRYFVVSDVHSCHDDFFAALSMAGYDPQDEEERLVFLGDLFDRGPQPIECFRDIRRIPRRHRILIRGNHEDLLLRALKTGDCTSADMQNGTVDTLRAFAHRTDRIRDALALRFAIEERYPLMEWLESDEWQDYFEAGPFLFVHASFPVQAECGGEIIEEFDWRRPSSGVHPDWSAARWPDPLEFSKSSPFRKERERGTVLVAGHRPNQQYWRRKFSLKEKDSPSEEDINLFIQNKHREDIYFDDHFIGLDGGCHFSGQMNVLVIDDSDWKPIPLAYKGEGR